MPNRRDFWAIISDMFFTSKNGLYYKFEAKIWQDLTKK